MKVHLLSPHFSNLIRDFNSINHKVIFLNVCCFALWRSARCLGLGPWLSLRPLHRGLRVAAETPGRSRSPAPWACPLLAAEGSAAQGQPAGGKLSEPTRAWAARVPAHSMARNAKLTGARRSSRTHLQQHENAPCNVLPTPAGPSAAQGPLPWHGTGTGPGTAGTARQRDVPPATESPPKRTAITLLARGLYVWLILYKQLFIR